MNPADAALLIVDDNEDNRYTLMRRLQREGYTNVTTAVDGQQALELLGVRRARREHRRGYRKLFLESVTQADRGCDFDFLASEVKIRVPRSTLLGRKR